MPRVGFSVIWLHYFGMFFRQDKQPAQRIVLTVPEPAIELTGPSKESKKILIVDDDAVIVKAFSLTLRSNGYRVVTATDAAEAISQVNSEKPDLLIVDVSLAADPIGCGASGWDGFQFAHWLHASSCRAPVIIMSGSDEPEYEARTSAAGARVFLNKSTSRETLLATIDLLISEKQPVGLVSR